MAILLQKDTMKIQIERKHGIALMISVGLLLTFIIFSNIHWLKSYDQANIAKSLEDRGIEPTLDNMNSFVRLKVILAVVGNTLILGLFSGIVWWSISKRRLGPAFGVFWLIIFGANAISTPFYSVQIDTLSILVGVVHGIIAIYMVVWISSLLAHRQRMRQIMASRRK